MTRYTHGLERTSPKGGPFIGRCIYCLKEGLPMKAALEECEAAPTQDEGIIDAIEGRPYSHKHPPEVASGFKK